ncbi:S41 family peptidase [Agaribacter marinus]|uniref:Interphotoreceptor retinoid-binding protein n=1 Tax=Agaribacter marinus TaxID=1431249 RepID=A0AA37WKH5_9ALTE|nr:S41 family peptidase [Agaribacter marinus]GLR71000.1 interphotoreceptor retinoid-binding protein [Agaribacter marinus]
MKSITIFFWLVSVVIFSTHAAQGDISVTQKRAVVEGVADLMERRYVYLSQGSEVANVLRRQLLEGKFQSITSKQALAEHMSTFLMEQTKDGHLFLEYKPNALREERSRDVASEKSDYIESEMEKYYGAHINHGFNGIQRLNNNIGYIDLTVFAPPNMAEDLAHAAMTLCAQFDALIFDLRNNGGGMGELGHIMMGYLFDETSLPLSNIYHRPSDTLTTHKTPNKLPKRRFGGKKPLYILTSKRTFSAAEAFAYDLQALKRATIVGEVTGGGAHPFEYHEVDHEFFLSLAEARSINPITKSNWQGVGVQPDVLVKNDRALSEAIDLANARLSQLN